MSVLAPNPGLVYYGRGELKLDLWSNGAATNIWKHMGMCSEFSTTVSTETEELENAMSGISSPYAVAISKTNFEGALKASEFGDQNLRLAFAGSTADLVQTSSTKTDSAPVGDPLMVKGASCFIGYYDVTAFTLKMAPSTALVLGTDYTFDAGTGEITILSTSSTFTDGTKLLWSGTVPAITSTAKRSIITPMASPNLLASLRFNTASDVQGTKRFAIYLPKVLIMPDGNTDWLKKGFGELSYKLKVQKHDTLGYGSVIEL